MRLIEIYRSIMQGVWNIGFVENTLDGVIAGEPLKIKCAVMPNTRDDVVRSMQAANMVNEEIEDALICSISMGSLGKVSRITGSLVGSCISFAALDAASAPGQLSYGDMNTIIKILEK